jgi:glycosyltransferase involved in cell wall biosynthesis
LGERHLWDAETFRMKPIAQAEVTAIVTAMTDGERPYLAECLSAILNEEEITAVILCIMDSNTWIEEVLKSVGAGHRIQVLRMSLDVPGVVRNEAVKHAETEWIAFCDGDDVWCKGKTAAQLAHAAAHNADFVAGDHYLTDEAGQIRAVALAKYLPMPSAWLVRTSVMQQHPFRDVPSEDHEWWFRTKNVIKRVRCPKLLLRYRVRPLSYSTMEPSKVRKARAVALGGMPVIGLGVLVLTWGMWLVNRSKSYRPLFK